MHPITQSAVVCLRTAAGKHPVGFPATVSRITPGGIRLRVDHNPGIPVHLLFRLNQFVDIFLSMPGPRGEVHTRGLLQGIATELAGVDNNSILLDLDFPAFSPMEEEALRDSNPLAVVF